MLIVGLGNPGLQYQNTHHNMGFMALDKIAEANSVEFKKSTRYNAEIAELRIGTTLVILLKPLTYMNLSGDSVKKYVKEKNVSLDEILVIHDDMDLPLGKIRIRKNGSSGGHTGIKSIIAQLNTQEFARVRIGIDKPVDATGEVIIDYVLKKFSKKEMETLEETLSKMPNMAEDFVNYGIDYIMNHYNSGNKN